VPKRVCELFAGVGGFRLGLGPAGWDVVWSNQWEPARKAQYASECYVSHFGDTGHSNEDVARVPTGNIPDHELLVGGFPCQDYSVATANARGISGQKGVLWWEIRRIVAAKRPGYLLLENVDRLLKSPTAQRGRDFGVILWCLGNLGYAVEWRAINAADYGAPQKRRRVFIFAAHKSTPLGSSMALVSDVSNWIHSRGFFALPFPVSRPSQRVLTPEVQHTTLPRSVTTLSRDFAFAFENAGLLVGRRVWTYRVEAIPEPAVVLGSILEHRVPDEYFVPPGLLRKWSYLKGAKAEKRKAETGFEYHYAEGPLPFPDPLDRPGRTILTDEGGVSPSRFKHIVIDPDLRQLRTLTPVEVERMNQFPDDWTSTGMPVRMRYFCMGNALVVGLIRRMGTRLDQMTGPQPINAVTVSRPTRRRGGARVAAL
jgi:DNA (cytosine-5)-methyltransferase 1